METEAGEFNGDDYGKERKQDTLADARTDDDNQADETQYHRSKQPDPQAHPERILYIYMLQGKRLNMQICG
jgi:hypothetical protein